MAANICPAAVLPSGADLLFSGSRHTCVQQLYNPNRTNKISVLVKSAAGAFLGAPLQTPVPGLPAPSRPAYHLRALYRWQRSGRRSGLLLVV